MPRYKTWASLFSLHNEVSNPFICSIYKIGYNPRWPISWRAFIYIVYINKHKLHTRKRHIHLNCLVYKSNAILFNNLLLIKLYHLLYKLSSDMKVLIFFIWVKFKNFNQLKSVGINLISYHYHPRGVCPSLWPSRGVAAFNSFNKSLFTLFIK